MPENTSHELAVGTSRAQLLMDYGLAGRYGLSDVVDDVAADLSCQYSELYPALKEWANGFGFERELGDSSALARNSVIDQIPGAISRTWREREGQRELALDLLEYDRVFSVRAAPIIMVMSAWLTAYQRGFAIALQKFREDPSQILDDSQGSGTGCIASPDQLQVDETVARFQHQKDLRAISLLRHAFQVGLNLNLRNASKSCPVAESGSIMLFSFDISRATEMMKGLDIIKDHSFNEVDVGAMGDIVVDHADYYANDGLGNGASAILRRMLMDIENIQSVTVIKDMQIIEHLGKERNGKNLLMSSRDEGHGATGDDRRDLGQLDQKQVMVA